MWYCNFCKIIVTNSDVKLPIKKKIQRLLIGFSLECPLMGALKQRKSLSLKVSAAAYGNVRLRECKNTEFVWEVKRGFKQGGRK